MPRVVQTSMSSALRRGVSWEVPELQQEDENAPNTLDHLQDALEATLAATQVPPSCSHAEPRRAVRLGLPRLTAA